MGKVYENRIVMKRKITASALVVATMLLFSSTILHAETIYPSNGESYEGPLVVVPDEDTPPHVAFGGYAPAVSLTPFARAEDGPTYHWGANIGVFSGSCYSESWNSDKTEKYPIDRIYASVSVYEHGVHAGDDTDIQYNSYTARASYEGDELSIVAGREAYGTHEFQEEGYETMEQESYASV